jgi:hypothetical protein
MVISSTGFQVNPGKETVHLYVRKGQERKASIVGDVLVIICVEETGNRPGAIGHIAEAQVLPLGTTTPTPTLVSFPKPCGGL